MASKQTIAWDATASTIEAEIESLSTVTTVNVNIANGQNTLCGIIARIGIYHIY